MAKTKARPAKPLLMPTEAGMLDKDNVGTL